MINSASVWVVEPTYITRSGWVVFLAMMTAWTCLALFSSTALAATPLPATKKPPVADYVFGVFPYLPPRELEKIFAPIAAEFARVLGHGVQFVSSSSYELFAAKLDAEGYDIAFVQPFDYVRAADQHHYLPLATRSEQLKALIVSTDTSAIKLPSDLIGLRISLPPMDAAVSHLVRAYLKENGLTPGKDVTLVYFRSHISCLQQVLIEATAACGTALPALRHFKARMNTDMRVLLETKPIPHTLFVAHSRLSEAQRKLLLDVILSWSKTPDGKEILARGKLTPFISVTNEAYNVVRAFPLE